MSTFVLRRRGFTVLRRRIYMSLSRILLRERAPNGVQNEIASNSGKPRFQTVDTEMRAGHEMRLLELLIARRLKHRHVVVV